MCVKVCEAMEMCENPGNWTLRDYLFIGHKYFSRANIMFESPIFEAISTPQ